MRNRMIALAAFIITLSSISTYAATQMSQSSLFIHTSYKNYSVIDNISNDSIIIPAKYGNMFVEPAATGEPRYADKKITYSATGSLIDSDTAIANIKSEHGSSYNCGSSNTFCFDLNASVKKGTTNTVWIKNLALYLPDKEISSNKDSKWELYDLKVSFKPEVNENYFTSISGGKSTGKYRYLFIGKSKTPAVSIYGINKCYIKFDYYKAGTSTPAPVSTYITYDDIDYGQGIWLGSTFPSPNGMKGPTYIAVSEDSDLGYTVKTTGTKQITQLSPTEHSSIIQDSMGLYYSAQSMTLGFNCNYMGGKYTGDFSWFGGKNLSMADREPNSPYEWVSESSQNEDKSKLAVLSSYDSEFTYNVQHVVAAGYSQGSYFKSYEIVNELPEFLDICGDIRVERAGEDVTKLFKISQNKGSVTASALSAALNSESFYGQSYSVVIPVRIKDVSGIYTVKELRKFLGSNDVKDDGTFTFSNKGYVNITTVTKQTYTELETNEVNVKVIFPLANAEIKAPARTSVNSVITVRGIVRDELESNDSDMSSSMELTKVTFGLKDQNNNKKGDDITISADDCESKAEYTSGDSTWIKRIFRTRMPIDVSPGDYYITMQLTYKCTYNGSISFITRDYKKSLIVTEYTSGAVDGIRYIDDDVILYNSIWSSGERESMLKSAFENENPEERKFN